MGDPACFLSETCLTCGRFLSEKDRDRENCVHCGEPLDGRAADNSTPRDPADKKFLQSDQR